MSASTSPSDTRSRVGTALRFVGECALAALLVVGTVELRRSHVPHLPDEVWVLRSPSEIPRIRLEPASTAWHVRSSEIVVPPRLRFCHARRRSAELSGVYRGGWNPVANGDPRQADPLTLMAALPDAWTLTHPAGGGQLPDRFTAAPYGRVEREESRLVGDAGAPSTDTWCLYRRQPVAGALREPACVTSTRRPIRPGHPISRTAAAPQPVQGCVLRFGTRSGDTLIGRNMLRRADALRRTTTDESGSGSSPRALARW